jgi:4-hydroxybenzoate polyprenyltransferase
VATLALRHPAPPAWWTVTAGALLGVAANLTNALPDLERDRRTGFRGLPSRIGARPSVALAAVLLVGAAAVLGFGPAGPPGLSDWVGMAVTLATLVALAPFGRRNPAGRMPFYALMVQVPVLLGMLAGNGHRLR